MATFSVDCFVNAAGNVVGCGASEGHYTTTNPYTGWGSNTAHGQGSGTTVQTGYQHTGYVAPDGSGRIGQQNTTGLFEEGLIRIPSPFGWDPFRDPIKGTNWVMWGLIVVVQDLLGLDRDWETIP